MTTSWLGKSVVKPAWISYLNFVLITLFIFYFEVFPRLSCYMKRNRCFTCEMFFSCLLFSSRGLVFRYIMRWHSCIFKCSLSIQTLFRATVPLNNACVFCKFTLLWVLHHHTHISFDLDKTSRLLKWTCKNKELPSFPN